MYTLEQLRGFVAVAEHLHFGRAAEALQMTQPALSRQIQKLEADLEVGLLARTNRHVELTAAGGELLEWARRILSLSESSRSAVRSVARGERGTLTIGFTATVALAILGPLLERLQEALPDVDINLHEQVRLEQLQGIDRGDLDLGLMRQVPTQGFGVREVFREDLVLAVPAGHPLAARGTSCTMDDVAAYPMIGYAAEGSGYFRHKVDALLGDRPVAMVHSVAQILSMLSLVARGFGVALVPNSVRPIGTNGVVFLELDVPQPLRSTAQVPLSAVWSRQSNNPALRRALEALDLPLTA